MDENKGSGSDKDCSLEQESKIKLKNRNRKRKRNNSNSSTDLDDVLPENIFEVEKNLHAAAIKNNLDDISVKKILKKVVTNDHVLALVKLREEEDNSGNEAGLRPKLTRSKVKELMKVSPRSTQWNIELSPIKHIPVKTRPEVTALIDQELPDDEEDDDYKPSEIHDESDDDHIIETCSDLDSEPLTPATPHKQTTNTNEFQDGTFKVPQNIATNMQKKMDQEEATIALRTRSKLSLSSTPIEHIESSFVPPDDLPVLVVDGLWNSFVEELSNPVAHTRHDDEDESDTDYNAAADPDDNDEDEENLENSIVKISKKELNDLFTELFNVLPEGAEEQLASGTCLLGDGNSDIGKLLWEGKKEPISDEEMNLPIVGKVERRDSISIGKMKPEDDEMKRENVLSTTVEKETLHTSVSTPPSPPSNTVKISVVEHSSNVLPPALQLQQPAPLQRLQHKNQPPSTVHVTMDVDMQIYPEQVLILEQQLRQHVQLAVTYFLQLFVHPVHWSYAHKYKEYLESLEKLTLSNPKSVANVCNLKPALELMRGWEESVSENTPENIELVEFIHKEVEKSRKRVSQNSVFLGDFPELFKSVVANSTVFLYPYLLPPSPFRADGSNKKPGYFLSEDSLIVLGLQQFSEFLVANPKMFLPPRPHARKRWYLATAVELTCKYMFPWVSVRSLLAHVHLVRRSGDKSNPLVKYFENNIIEPVKHKLIPINASLTLYEQPEFEIPRIWIKYLAKTSKRFKDSLYRKSNIAIQPSGVDVTSQVLEPQQKRPLPIDFIKPIPCDRNNVLPKTESVLVNKVDVEIKSEKEPVIVATNIYKLVPTSSGAQLLPLNDNTSTVDSATTPIFTPNILNSVSDTTVPDTPVGVMQNEDKTKEQIKPKEMPNHCNCCVLLRRICKTRQSLITEYFKNNTKVNRSCGCRNRKYPKITRKLKLLVNNYKAMSLTAHCNLINRIKACKPGHGDLTEEGSLNFNDRDFVDAMKFQIKLMQRSSVARNNKMKLRIYSAFSNFDCEDGNPLELIDKLYRIFDVELADMYTELLTFLSPLQADQIKKYKEYFKRNCVQDLIAKIDEHVKDDSVRSDILCQIKADIYKHQPACEMCYRLLNHMHNYPELASYTFDLFPHLWKDESNSEDCSKLIRVTLVTSNENLTSKENLKDVNFVLNTVKSQLNDKVVTNETAQTVEYEADDSSSSEEEANVTLTEKNKDDIEKEDMTLVTPITHDEIASAELSVTKTETHENSSDMSMLTSDNDSVKSEPSDWKRDEDKLILQVLKQFLTPEQIKDKTIIEVIEENLLVMIAENLMDKSLDDVRERVLYLLHILGSDA